MDIETVDDLANQIADWLGVYGTCKDAEHGIDCEKKDTFCCRMGFIMELSDRIKKAADNDTKLESVNLK